MLKFFADSLRRRVIDSSSFRPEYVFERTTMNSGNHVVLMDGDGRGLEIRFY